MAAEENISGTAREDVAGTQAATGTKRKAAVEPSAHTASESNDSNQVMEWEYDPSPTCGDPERSGLQRCFIGGNVHDDYLGPGVGHALNGKEMIVFFPGDGTGMRSRVEHIWASSIYAMDNLIVSEAGPHMLPSGQAAGRQPSQRLTQHTHNHCSPPPH